VGDNGNTPGGAATTYLVRYSTSEIVTQTDWDNATAISSGIPTPKQQNQAESMVVSGLTAGQTYYFAVRARDEAGNSGGISNSPSAAASSTPATTAGNYDDSDSSVWTYSGTWTTYSGTGPYNNTLHQTNVKNDYAEVTFNGVKFTVKYLKASGRGSFDVVIDGTKVDTVSANSSTLIWQATWTSNTLTPGEHTVKFVNTGSSWVDFDAIQIYAATTGVGSGTYDDNDDTAWTYSGTWTIFNGSGPYDNTLHQNNSTGNYAELVFNGQQIKLTYLKAPGRGSIDIYIDGKKVDTINANNDSLVWQATWTSAPLTAGTHVVRFVNTSNLWIDLDAIQITP
jgi:hypothetical protein